MSRLKLKQSSPESLGTFEALEFLVLGIHGKWVLWRALNAVAASDSRLAGVDFDRLATRAESQRESVDEQTTGVCALRPLPGTLMSGP